MRRVVVVGVAVLGGVLAWASIAYAANTYKSTSKITPSRPGTPSKPTPVSASLTFKIGSTDPSVRPSPIKTYSIGLGPGVVPNNTLFGGCSFSQANATTLPTACKKSVVGSGSVDALAGPTSSPTSMLPCHLAVRLINQVKKNHLSIRVDGGPTLSPPCVVAQHASIDATFVKTGRVAGAHGGHLDVWAIKFTVPPALLHAIPGFDTSVTSNVSNVTRLATKTKVHGKTVTHGYLESVGCPQNPKGKRVSTVIFTPEIGQSSISESTSACR